MRKAEKSISTENGLSRRTFLERLFTATVVGTVAPSVLLGQATPRINLREGEFNGIYTIDINDADVLQTIGGSIRLLISEISPTFRIIVTRVSEDHFEAVNSQCPHEGHKVKPREGTNDYLECEAHQSHFQFDGTYISGPANGLNLIRYNTTFDGISLVNVEIDVLASIEDSIGREAWVTLHSSGPLPNQIVFEFLLDTASRVTLGIWSLEGEEVLRPLDEFKEAGTYYLPCDTSPLSSGLYLYRLMTPSRVIGTGKLII